MFSRLIDTRDELTRLADHLSNRDILAIDTEFIRERSYWPRLELLQVADREGTVVAIDYGRLGIREDDPFLALLTSPQIKKVFHAAEQDLDILATYLDRVLPNVFDTQLAAGFAGLGARPGYGPTVEALVGIRLPKGESLTDWSLRPLTENQLTYALDDVRHLLTVHDRLVATLERNGRLPWAQQEVDKLVAAIHQQRELRRNPDTLYLRVRGRNTLDAQGLAILQALARWREEEAIRRDRPRGSILKDELLVEVARRAPKGVGQLERLRGFTPRDLDRHGETLIGLVREVLARGRQTYPQPESSSPPPDDATLALTELLQAITHAVATESGMPAGLLATHGELQRLADLRRRGEPLNHPLMEGWRGELLGSRLVDMLEGRSAVRWDPEAGCMRIETTNLKPSSAQG